MNEELFRDVIDAVMATSNWFDALNVANRIPIRRGWPPSPSCMRDSAGPMTRAGCCRPSTSPAISLRSMSSWGTPPPPIEDPGRRAETLLEIALRAARDGAPASAG